MQLTVREEKATLSPPSTLATLGRERGRGGASGGERDTGGTHKAFANRKEGRRRRRRRRRRAQASFITRAEQSRPWI